MKRRSGSWIAGVLVLISAATAVAESPIRSIRQEDTLYLSAQDIADALKFELKIVDPKKLVTFCRTQNGGFCLPLRLTADNHRREGEQLFVAADAVSQALRFRVDDRAGKITVTPSAEPADAALQNKPGYNTPWPEGRGFAKGQTLPDIPLVDVEGKEVRFSAFLGQRYILYCWASW